uniref:Protein phosphatase 1 regulatory inhibitor subunit 2 n=1 Tax=Suricata suricatta TaxID=37032 RepID=A0A673T343_SURSU
MAASTASQQPIKGILKNKSSTTSSVVASSEQPGPGVDKELSKKSQRWDEMNILATFHPADKDYGLMKIDEPSTPGPSMVGDDEDALRDSEAPEGGTPDILAKKFAAAKGSEPKYRVHEQESRVDEDSDPSSEEQRKKQQFAMRRKLHYNEGLNMKLARQLISKDLHDEEEEEEMSETAAADRKNSEQPNRGSATSDQMQNRSQSS